MRRLLCLAPIAAAALVMTSTSNARADSGDGYIAVVAVALFDVISLPADIYMAAAHERVPHDYAMAEAIAGGVQAFGAGIGIGACAGDRDCRRSAGLPVLIGFTAWTTAMSIHGIYSLSKPGGGTASSAPKPSPFAIVPMVGDGRTTPAGLGFVGTF